MWLSASEMLRRMQYGFELRGECSMESHTSRNLLMWCIIPKIHMPSSSQLKNNPLLLGQVLTVANQHHQIVKMDLRSQFLDSLKAIVFNQDNQTPETLQEKTRGLVINMDSRISPENGIEKESREWLKKLRDYSQLRLELVQYKLKMKFKSDLNGGILAEREEPLC